MLTKEIKPARPKGVRYKNLYLKAETPKHELQFKRHQVFTNEDLPRYQKPFRKRAL